MHQDNDLGIMGSLPQYINRDLLKTWVSLLPSPQDQLLTSLINLLEDGSSSPLTPNTRIALAHCIRQHYQTYPTALALQARGSVLPPTVANHSAAEDLEKKM